MVSSLVVRDDFVGPFPHHLPHALIGSGKNGKHEVFKCNQTYAHLNEFGVPWIARVPNTCIIAFSLTGLVWQI